MGGACCFASYTLTVCIRSLRVYRADFVRLCLVHGNPCAMSSVLHHRNPCWRKKILYSKETVRNFQSNSAQEPMNEQATHSVQSIIWKPPEFSSISTTQYAVLYNNENVAVFVLQLCKQYLLLDSRWLSKDMEVVTNELNSARLEKWGASSSLEACWESWDWCFSSRPPGSVPARLVKLSRAVPHPLPITGLWSA